MVKYTIQIEILAKIFVFIKMSLFSIPKTPKNLP